jgi:hypothetical protein
MRWVLLKDRKNLAAEQHKLVSKMTGSRTARAWHYREQLRARSSCATSPTSCAPCCTAGAATS